MHVHSLVADQEAVGQRLDAWLAKQGVGLSRSQCQRLIAEGRVTVNGSPASNNHRLQAEDRVEVEIPAPEPLAIVAEDIPLEIVYQDKDVAVINKPSGMVTHPAQGNYTGTLVNALLYQLDDLSGINGVLRPGIVHRLDKDTSGLLLIAKHDLAHRFLAEQLKERLIKREYVALVHGQPSEESGTIDAPLDRHPVLRKKMAVVASGRQAVTHYRVVAKLGDYCLVIFRLETGRTHQIRVHASYIKHPIVGDLQYGPKKPHLGAKGQLLHAWRLTFAQPTSCDLISVTAKPPQNFMAILNSLCRKHKALTAEEQFAILTQEPLN